jgi:hypothetical protein
MHPPPSASEEKESSTGILSTTRSNELDRKMFRWMQVKMMEVRRLDLVDYAYAQSFDVWFYLTEGIKVSSRLTGGILCEIGRQ